METEAVAGHNQRIPAAKIIAPEEHRGARNFGSNRLQLEGRDLAELISALDKGFTSIDFFETAIVETGRSVKGYATIGDVKKDAIRKVVKGAASEQWMQQLLDAVRNSERAQNNGGLLNLIDELLKRLQGEAQVKKAFTGEGDTVERHYDRLTRPGAFAGRAIPSAAREVSALPPEVMNKVCARLMRFMGPISKNLVREESQRVASLEELTLRLAEFITDENEKALFINSILDL